MAEGDREMTDDPNEAYEVVPTGPGPHGPPKGWWTAKRNGLPVRHFPGKGNAQRYATDPEYRASLAAGKAHRHHQPDSRLHAGMRDRRAPGYGFLRTELPTILATRTDALSPRMLRVIEELAGDWRRLDPRIDGLSGEIEALAPSRSGMFAPDDSTWHRADHFERHGGGDRHWRRILQRPRLRRLARTGAQADLDGRPH